MKVLLVHMEFPSIIGGGGRYTQNLIKGLSNSGVETVLVTSGTSDSDERIGDFLIIHNFFMKLTKLGIMMKMIINLLFLLL